MPHSLDALSRRRFLHQGAAATAVLCLPRLSHAAATEPAASAPAQAQTVLGPIPATELGLTLTHEHVLVDFIGADRVSPDRYDRAEARQVILPHLREARELGCRTMVECTPAYLGRDVRLLRDLARETGLHLLTNTGYYGAADNKFLPPHAFTETAAELAARWIAEAREGIEGTGIKPGFIKIGVGGTTLSALHRKLVLAAAQTHLATGLTIASHTGRGNLALEQLALLRQADVRGDAFIWVHAQNEPDPEVTLRAAREGCWVSYDGFEARHTEKYVAMFRRLAQQGRLRQLLLSHDAGWFRPGEAGGGKFRPFDGLFRVLLTALKQADVTQEQIDEVLIRNPGRAFVTAVRKPN